MKNRGMLLAALLILLGGCVPRVEVRLPQPPDLYTLGPTYFCGYRKGSPLPHQVFAAIGGDPVSITLLGGDSAAVGVEESYAPEGSAGGESPLLGYPGALSGCLRPAPSTDFTPGGNFTLVHTFGPDRQKIYSLDELNASPRGMRAYQALDLRGEPVGVLVMVEEWVDADYNDAVLLLKGAAPLR